MPDHPTTSPASPESSGGVAPRGEAATSRVDLPLALAGGLAIWGLLTVGPLLRGLTLPSATTSVWVLMALPLGVLAVALHARSVLGLIAGVPFSYLPLLLTQPVLTSPKAHDAASFSALLIATFALVASGSGLRPRGRADTGVAGAAEPPSRLPRIREASLLAAFAIALLVPLLRLGFDLGLRARFIQSHGADATRAMTLAGLLVFTGWALSARAAIVGLGSLSRNPSSFRRMLSLERARLENAAEARFNLVLALVVAVAAALALYAYLGGDVGGSRGDAP